MNVIFMTCSLQNLILSPSYRVFALRSSLLSAASFGVQEEGMAGDPDVMVLLVDCRPSL